MYILACGDWYRYLGVSLFSLCCLRVVLHVVLIKFTPGGQLVREQVQIIRYQ